MKRSLLLLTTAIAAPRAFANTKPRVEPELTGIHKIAMPTRINKRGSVSVYPFDSLTEVGQAFGIKNKTAAQISSIVSNANRKALVPVKDADNNAVYDTKEITGADGTKTVVPDTNKPKMKAGKHFFAHDVDKGYRDANKEAFAKGGAFEGVTVLIFRDA